MLSPTDILDMAVRILEGPRDEKNKREAEEKNEKSRNLSVNQ